MIGRNMKNVLVVSFGFLCLFTAYGGLQNLQSSLNAEQGLGVASLSVIYAALILSAILFPPLLIKTLGCKWTIVASMACYVTYSCGNLYSGWETLIPTSAVLGLGGGPLWSAKCTYLALSAQRQARKEHTGGEDEEERREKETHGEDEEEEEEGREKETHGEDEEEGHEKETHGEDRGEEDTDAEDAGATEATDSGNNRSSRDGSSRHVQEKEGMDGDGEGNNDTTRPGQEREARDGVRNEREARDGVRNEREARDGVRNEGSIDGGNGSVQDEGQREDNSSTSPQAEEREGREEGNKGSTSPRAEEREGKEEGNKGSTGVQDKGNMEGKREGSGEANRSSVSRRAEEREGNREGNREENRGGSREGNRGGNREGREEGHSSSSSVSRRAEVLLTQYFGIFFSMFQSSAIWGNLLSSAIFSQDTHIADIPEEALQYCGVGPCADEFIQSGNATRPEQKVVYTLMGCYIGMGLVAIASVAFFLDDLDGGVAKEFRGSGESLRSTVMATMRLLGDRKLQLLIPMTIYSGLEQCYLFAEFTKNYVTCALGIRFIGYSMICFGACDSVCSLVFGKIAPLTGRMALFGLAALTNFCCIMGLLFWRPHPDHFAVFFLVPGLWGMADGVWQTQINAMYGVLFPDHKEAAFANYRLWESVGALLAFGYSSHLCLSTKTYLLLSCLVLSMLAYPLVELLARREAQYRLVSQATPS